MTSPRPRRATSAALAVLAGSALLVGAAGASWAAPASDPAPSASAPGEASSSTVVVQQDDLDALSAALDDEKALEAR